MAAPGGTSPIGDQRKDIRLNRFLIKGFFVDDAAFLGTIRNESRGGLYVQTTGPFFSGQKVTCDNLPRGQKKEAAFSLRNGRCIGEHQRRRYLCCQDV